MKKNNALLWSLLVTSVYAVLFIHDTNLYPELSIIHRLILSLLRLFLLIVPITLAALFRTMRPSRIRSVTLVISILFIPYTLYSVTEVRHITELCPVSTGIYFTDSCSLASWKLLPPIAYALIGIGAFCLCLQLLCIHKLRWRISLLVLYISLATQFALQSRLNIWNLLTQPAEVFQEIAKATRTQEYWLNSTAFLIFFISITAIIIILSKRKTDA